MKEDIVYQSVQDVSSSPRDHLRPYYTLKKNVLIIIIIIPRKQIQIKYKNEVLSQATLIGTPARLLIHAIIHSANHVAAKSCRRMSRASVNVHREMVVGAKRAGLSIIFFLTADLLEFSCTTVCRVYAEWQKKSSSKQQYHEEKLHERG